MATMKAVGVKVHGDAENLQVFTVPKPIPEPHDILVKVKAVSMNPVDTKVRKGTRFPSGDVHILGYDAAGIVEALGSEVKNFKVGDEVYYAGSVVRQGCNAEYHTVDARIVGKKPKSLTWEQAAAVPLCAITVWEALFEQLLITPSDSGKSILIVNGAGGVGSLAIQIAKKVCKLRVIATASRQETVDYVKKMGADDVINHKENMLEQLKKLGLNGVDYAFDNVDLRSNFAEVVEAVKTMGKIVSITPGAPKEYDLSPAFYKRITLTFEYMFARSAQNIEPEKQGELLNKITEMIEKNELVDRVTKTMKLSTDLVEAHKLLESGSTIGKIVLVNDL